MLASLAMAGRLTQYSSIPTFHYSLAQTLAQTGFFSLWHGPASVAPGRAGFFFRRHCPTSVAPGRANCERSELSLSWFKAAGKGALFTAIVGRRRTGKTRLWLEASKKMNNCLYLFCLPGPFKKTLDQVEPQLYALGFTSMPQDLTQFFKAVSLFLSKGETLTIFFDEVQNLFLEERGELALFQWALFLSNTSVKGDILTTCKPVTCVPQAASPLF